MDFIKRLELESGLSNWSVKDYLQEIVEGNNFFLIARKDGEPLGFILARLIMTNCIPIPDTEINTGLRATYELEIYNLAVREEFRREKVASRLMNRLLKLRKLKTIEKIHLEVRESNRTAQKFYHRQSFKIIGVRRNFYNNPSENAILMSRSLIEEEPA